MANFTAKRAIIHYFNIILFRKQLLSVNFKQKRVEPIYKGTWKIDSPKKKKKGTWKII